MSDKVYISSQDNQVSLSQNNNILVITDSDQNQIIVTQPITNTIEVNTPGPQGQKGDIGPQGPSGSLQNNSSGSFQITGSLFITGSSPLTIVGPSTLSGSLIVTQGITGSLLGTSSFAINTSTASFAPLYTLTSSFNSFTSSYVTDSGSFNTRITNNSSSISSLSSSFVSFSGSYNTGSFTGSFKGDGSGLTNIPASGITGLNLSQIATGSVSASVSTGTGSFTITSGSTNLLFVSSSGNIGIGTTTPSHTLDISGSGNFTKSLTVTGSLTVSGSGNFTNNLTVTGSTFISSSNATQLQVGNNSLFVSRSGDVGIGTSTPVYKLDIQSTINSVFRASAPDPALEILDGSSNSWKLQAVNNSRFRIFHGGSSDIFNILINGSVGIGTSTPSSKLNVVGSTLLQNGQTTVRGSGATSATTAFRVENSAGTARLTILNDGTSAFNTNALFISGSGLVGIGTSSPITPLDINGRTRIAANSGPVGAIGGTSYGLSIQNNAVNSYLEILNNGGVGKGGFFGMSTNDFELWNYQGGPINFYTGTTASTGTVRLIIANDGNVLIGTSTNSGFKIDVSGSGRFKNTLTLAHDTPNSTALFVSGSGRVGIGTPNPSSSLHISGASAILSLSPIDPLPTTNIPSASFATSGSGADLKPYFWNGSTWTALF